MENYIEHSEFVNLYIKDQKIFERIFKNCNLFNTFKNNMLKECENYTKFSYTEEQGSEKMMGDIFEIFSELFFKILGADPRVGVYSYKPDKIDAVGIDAIGLSIEEKNITIQCKFKVDSSYELLERDIKQFPYKSIKRFNVEKNNMILFTSSKGLNWFTASNVFDDDIRVINYGNIRSFVDNNFVFWKLVEDYIDNTIKIKF